MNEDTLKSYLQVDRLDIICGNTYLPIIHPCEKCKKESCIGKNECKGFGAYSYGLTIR